MRGLIRLIFLIHFYVFFLLFLSFIIIFLCGGVDKSQLSSTYSHDTKDITI